MTDRLRIEEVAALLDCDARWSGVGGTGFFKGNDDRKQFFPFRSIDGSRLVQGRLTIGRDPSGIDHGTSHDDFADLEVIAIDGGTVLGRQQGGDQEEQKCGVRFGFVAVHAAVGAGARAKCAKNF